MSEIETPTETTDDNSGMEPETDNTNRSGGSEAAKYRIKLREVEAERDALTARLEAAQRANVSQVVGSRVQDVSDFWEHTELASVLDDDGNVSTEAITAAVDALLESKPHYQKRPTPMAPHVNIVQGDAEIKGGDAPSWDRVLKGSIR